MKPLNSYKIIIPDINTLNLDITLDCGQCFRWKKSNNAWQGIVNDNIITVYNKNSDLIIESFKPIKKDLILNYFDLTRNYAKILDVLKQDTVMLNALSEFNGIHILNQPPWEALCSFIISQNNNIPRIKGIITRLCKAFGEHIKDDTFTFPSAEIIASLNESELDILRAGFRTKYILDAAKKITSGQVDFSFIKTLPYNDASVYLQQIKGVGPKVADCVLLFSLGFFNAFPEDVWIKRAILKYYPGGLPLFLVPYGGLVQQYIYHYSRMHDKSF
jgi:3-methyladenine DNA glycosylase/8-oxoguanine DNA glycosylase